MRQMHRTGRSQCKIKLQQHDNCPDEIIPNIYGRKCDTFIQFMHYRWSVVRIKVSDVPEFVTSAPEVKVHRM